ILDAERCKSGRDVRIREASMGAHGFKGQADAIRVLVGGKHVNCSAAEIGGEEKDIVATGIDADGETLVDGTQPAIGYPCIVHGKYGIFGWQGRSDVAEDSGPGR